MQDIGAEMKARVDGVTLCMTHEEAKNLCRIIGSLSRGLLTENGMSEEDAELLTSIYYPLHKALADEAL
jgi:hypothetical protein